MTIRRHLTFLFLAMAASIGHHVAHAASDSDLEGTYYLSGVREVGAQFRLSAKGRFQFAMSYGGADVSAEGAWQAADGRVTLTTDPRPEPSLKLGELRDTLIEPFASETETPSLLVVQVVSPKLGVAWSNMEVTANFSNGLQRSGTTSLAGLGFLERSDDAWKGATVKSVSVGHTKKKIAPVLIPVEPGKTKTVLVHLDPGSMVAPAFESLELKQEREHGGTVSLVKTGENDAERWAFTRR